ncbi:hypothetical protein BDY21DRAFT_344802 [Lineolata rhizophorae]|uniref:Pre-rRNA-processing protein RIX1 N-terminal domain-containing protein n=1 Tax=Lineolata rhizophorae TaxID=578093 RepID=A0A6A6NZY6_9PEZI|nr:hypothetical protein BDY21DRAFT_344802 [Lineolata rhizophorae]
MAGSSPSAVDALNSVSNRLQSLQCSQVALHVPSLAATLRQSCAPLLRSTPSTSAEASSVSRLHRYLKILLSNDHPGARLAALVLVRTVVDLGEHAALAKNGAEWTDELLSMLSLSKPSGELAASRKIVVLLLTRIFLAVVPSQETSGQQIGKQKLVTFIGECLSLVGCSKDDNGCGEKVLSTGKILRTRSQREVLPVVLDSFTQLLPFRPGPFRLYLSQIRELLASVIGWTAPAPATTKSALPIPPITPLPADTTRRAARLLTQLHVCSPNNGAALEWETTIRQVISATHLTADKLFRAVKEDRKSVWDDDVSTRDMKTGGLKPDHADTLGLPNWSGFPGGTDRIVALIELLSAFLGTGVTYVPVKMPIGLLADLVKRILCFLPPPPPSRAKTNDSWNRSRLQYRQEISAEERAELFMIALPRIHVAVLRLVRDMLKRFGPAIMGLIGPWLDMVVGVFEAEAHVPAVRGCVYEVVEEMARMVGSGLTEDAVSSLEPVMNACAEEVLTQEPNGSDKAPAVVTATENKVNGSQQTGSTSKSGKKGKNQSKQTSGAAGINVDALLPASSASSKASPPPISPTCSAARALLPILLAYLPARHISLSIRAALDRAAILTASKDALLASVINPPVNEGTNSTMPFLARLYGEDMDVEGVVRARLVGIGCAQLRTPLDVNVEQEQNTTEDAEGGASEKGMTTTADNMNVDVEASPESCDVPTAAAQSRTAPDQRPSSSHKRPATGDGDGEGQPQKKSRIETPLESTADDGTAFTETVLAEETGVPGPTNDASSEADDAGRERDGDTARAVAGRTIGCSGTGIELGTGNTVEDDDEDGFEIPELHMGADSDEESKS